jgi:hypothetical protein
MKKWMALGFLILLSAACSTTASKAPLREIGHSERFVAYDNGTVKDLSTGLMWAAFDNGGPITWDDAKKYCENYRGGGYEDWRMPTQEELKDLYNPKLTNPHPRSEGCQRACHLTRFIHLSCCPVWSWNGITEVETFFHFGRGPGDWRDRSLDMNHPRALPVRGAE